MNHKYNQLKELLRELFQLDQPDLDFGLYRVMHAKSGEITQFLEKDLLPQVQTAFNQHQTADKEELERELSKAIDNAKALGVNPDDAPQVKKLRTQLANNVVNVVQLESEVYDHLYSFFRRYYADGDFIAKRVYKQGVYAIPYEGEEVTLHWANKDQYYIKTSEYLRDYTFRLRPDDESNPMRVHFKLIDATEEEHGNVKVAEGKERRFMLVDESPLVLEDGELVIRLTYRPDTRKQPEINKAIEAAVLANDNSDFKVWTDALKALAPTDKVAARTILAKHLHTYWARGRFDYFIHKDLGGFLRRELDFFIKNEIMHLDDVENELAPRVEQYLSKIKVIRKIAGKIIDFLAQLEDFQKKLWLKRKFVVEAQYLISVGSIPEEFYPEIAANKAQREEWVRLLAIDELKSSDGELFEAGMPVYSVPLTAEFLRAHPTLMIDTRYFEPGISERLLQIFDNVSESTAGVLFHGENYQVLRIAKNAIAGKVKCIYIDPPYNTGSGDFAYKDAFRRSSWLSMMSDRLSISAELLSHDAFLFGSIDDNEVRSLSALIDSQLHGHPLPTITWEKRTKAQNTKSARQMLQSKTEYILGLRTGSGPQKFMLEIAGTKDYPLTDEAGAYRLDPIGQMAASGVRGRKSMIFPILGVNPRSGMQWKLGKGEVENLVKKGLIVLINGEPSVIVRKDNEDESRYTPFWSHFFDKDAYGTAEVGASEVRDDLGFGRIIETVKPLRLVQKLLSHCTHEPRAIILDYFAGSGTTGHAVINLNREDAGTRVFLLAEVAHYFDLVLLPRIKKAAFTTSWRNGQPSRLATTEEAYRSPRVIKVIRLESYEDTLNNLEPSRSSAQQSLLDADQAQGGGGLKEQYMLRYMLNVETRGSQSLLNVQAFKDPTAYKLKVKRPGSDESRVVNVDLLETFNWLIGLTVKHIAAPQTFAASFVRDAEQRLKLESGLKQQHDGPYWFRTVTGTTPDGRKALVVWRKLTDNPEQDNLVLDEWFTKQRYSAKDSEYDIIWVNGGNNLENLKTPDKHWKVRLIEEDFHDLMFDTEGAS